MTQQAVVLVVEDHPLIRLNTVDFLEVAGYDVLEAASADAAIALLEARADIQLVFTDVEMPGTMDGLKLVHYVRDRWPPIKLIVTSGKVLVEASQLPDGARFLPKPYHEDTIVEAIGLLLAEVRRGSQQTGQASG